MPALVGLGAVGWLLGLASVAVVLARPATEDLRVGSWETAPAAGSRNASAHTRARVAIGGLFALDARETRYYRATADSDGRPLTGACDYRVRGGDLDARWWSITAYGRDQFLIPNEAGRYSFSKTTIEREPDDRFEIRVSAYPQPGNWLPVKDRAPFDLLARFYVPGEAVARSPGSATLPIVERAECRS